MQGRKAARPQGRKAARPQGRKVARPQGRKAARPQGRKAARPQAEGRRPKSTKGNGCSIMERIGPSPPRAPRPPGRHARRPGLRPHRTDWPTQGGRMFGVKNKQPILARAALASKAKACCGQTWLGSVINHATP